MVFIVVVFIIFVVVVGISSKNLHSLFYVFPFFSTTFRRYSRMHWSLPRTCSFLSVVIVAVLLVVVVIVELLLLLLSAHVPVTPQGMEMS